MKKEFYIIVAILILILATALFFLYEQRLENERRYELEKQELINQEKEIELERQKAIDKCIERKREEGNPFTARDACEKLYKSEN